MGKMKKPALTFSCEWNECDHEDSDEDRFYKHVAYHIPDLKVLPSEDWEMYECCWKNCVHNSDNSEEIVRHVKYHGYHAILKARGAAAAAERKLPPCNYSEMENSSMQSWSRPMICYWNDCEAQFSGLREFICHVRAHCNELSKPPYKCGWSDCPFSSPKIRSKIFDHVKVHTGERMLACPVCGNTFANKTKFEDHCIRQRTSMDDESLKCGFCFTYLPNERIFKDHLRHHVHHHKCCFCELTCTSQSVLVEHIRYRHLPSKPFKCSSCSYSCKAAFDLKQHLKSHTKDNAYYSCNQKNCNFKCLRQAALMRHYCKVHEDNSNKEAGYFACHLCEKKFTRGTGLTRHLEKTHNIQKPKGFSRFIYRHEGDGCYRLRTVRIESLDVNAEDAENKDSSGENVDDPDSDLNEVNPPHTIIDVLNERGEVVSSSSIYSEPVIEAESLPPDAKIVAVCSIPES